jgi:hypothetical protein
MNALVVHTTKLRQEMLEDVDLGDGNGELKAIFRSYYCNTTGGYQAAILAFYSRDTSKAANSAGRTAYVKGQNNSAPQWFPTRVCALQNTAQNEDNVGKCRCTRRMR